jgi:hypothetical protein
MDGSRSLEGPTTVASEEDLRILFNVPPDAEIRFIGPPPLCLNPALNNLTAPSRFLHHPLVENCYFFTLPRPLWDDVFGRLGEERFGSDTVEMEWTLSGIVGDHSTRAGFWKGRAFSYDLLQPKPKWRPSAEGARSVRWEVNQATLDEGMRHLEERSERFVKVTRAYAGWLLTNRQFLDEHDALFTEWSEVVQRWGLDRLGILLPREGFLPGDDPTADPRWPDYSAAFDEFFTRWRLQKLAAPYLPVPLQPLMAGCFPTTVVQQVNRAGGAYCLPDTFPVPSRDDLRNMLEDSLHGSSTPDHLKEWMAHIARDNAARRPLIRFARLFELQHYWRIIRRRHARAIRGQVGVLKEVLGGFLGVSKDTVHRDLLFITKRLRKGWAERGAFPFGPS